MQLQDCPLLHSLSPHLYQHVQSMLTTGKTFNQVVGGLAYMCCNAKLWIFNHVFSTWYRPDILACWDHTHAAHHSGTQVVTYHPQTSGTCLGLSWFLMGYEAALAMPHMPWVSAALRAILKKPPSPQPAPLHHTHSHVRFQPWPSDHPNTTNTLSVNIISAGQHFATILISTDLLAATWL